MGSRRKVPAGRGELYQTQTVPIPVKPGRLAIQGDPGLFLECFRQVRKGLRVGNDAIVHGSSDLLPDQGLLEIAVGSARYSVPRFPERTWHPRPGGRSSHNPLPPDRRARYDADGVSSIPLALAMAAARRVRSPV